MGSSTLPESYVRLLEQPLFAHLATVRPDGSPQSNVMWFAWDGAQLRFTHTSARQKFRNLEAEPRVALSIIDPDDPYSFLEVRGRVASVEPDPGGAFYKELQQRYGMEYPVHDADVRIVVTVQPDDYVAVRNGQVIR
jgi:PPOX class probable F420-dependent enzyme